MKISKKITICLAQSLRFTIALAFVLLSLKSYGQIKNLVGNGGFEGASYQRALLWDGVDSDGYLAGARAGALAIGLTGTTEVPMPLSVCMVDINGDGLPDLVTADPIGIIRAYINQGTKTEPKFTNAEVVPVFLSRDQNQDRRRAIKINLYDWSRRGLLDLVAGNYAGEVFYIPNTGTASAPDFRQPDDIAKVMLPTTDGGKLWGNLFAPVAYDMNKDGKTDLLLGEGSYSANAVHLLLNKSSSSRPEFSDEARYYLAYGDGREHLVPTIADFNGDGYPDLIVSDREGKVGVYLNPGPTWKPGIEFPLSQFISFGSSTSLGGPVTICAADYNGDGLFDLIIGKSNGRTAVAINRGTKDQPKFDPPADIKGTSLWGRALIPSQWNVDEGYGRGNMYAYVSVVNNDDDANATPPEGKNALKIAYYPCPNKVFKKPEDVMPALKNPSVSYDKTKPDKAPVNGIHVGTSNMAAPKLGSTYTIAFKAKGHALKSAVCTFTWHGVNTGAPLKIERGERGSAKISVSGRIEERESDRITFNVTDTWTTVQKTVQIDFKNPQLKAAKQTSESSKSQDDAGGVRLDAGLDFDIFPTPNQGVLYLDDVQVVERQ